MEDVLLPDVHTFQKKKKKTISVVTGEVDFTG